LRLLLVTDAWLPQVNGVVTALPELHAGAVYHPTGARMRGRRLT
jgi:hypothetical protein